MAEFDKWLNSVKQFTFFNLSLNKIISERKLFGYSIGISVIWILLRLNIMPTEYRAYILITLKEISIVDDNTSRDNIYSTKFRLQQITYLGSESLVEKALKNLNLDVTYFKNQTFNNIQLSPEITGIKVSIIKNTLTTDKSFDITVINSKYFEISNDGKKNIYAFGQKVRTAGIEFVISNVTKKDHPKKITVRISNLNALTNNYLRSLNLTFSAADSNKVILSLPFETENNTSDVLREIKKLYYNNHQNSEYALIKIDFINKQLDSLKAEMFAAKTTIDANKITQIKKKLNSFNNTETYKADLKKQQEILKTIEYYVKIPPYQFSFIPNTFILPDSTLRVLINKLNDSELQLQKLSAKISDPLLVKQVNYAVVKLKASTLKKIDSINVEMNKSIQARTYQKNNDKPLNQLKTEQQTRIKLYLYLLKKRESIQSTVPLTQRIDNQKVSLLPKKKSWALSLLTALLVGTIIPVVYLLFAEINKHKLLINQINIPILGTFNRYEWSDKILSPIEYDTFYGRKLLSIKSQLENISAQKVFIFTSLSPSEEKSFFATNMAASMAYNGKQILIIETERTNIHKNLLKSEFTKGLSDFLNDHTIKPADITFLTTIPNLEIIGPGISPSSSKETFDNSRMEILLKHVTTIYDYIFIDAGILSNTELTELTSSSINNFIYILSNRDTSSTQIKTLDFNYRNKLFKNIYLIINNYN